jgi:C4-type Zn-finger protein
MREIKCPICGKILKIITEDPAPLEKKIVKIHCNKCNTDIEQEV